MATLRRCWIGRYIIVVGVIHLVFGFVIYADAWNAVLSDGFVATVDDFSIRATAYWFAAFAPVLMIKGGLIDHLEAQDDRIPTFVAPALTVTLAAMLVPMPQNGGWLLPVPVFALWKRRLQKTAV